MDLDEALALADEAEANGHLNKFPRACIALAREIRRLKDQHAGAYTEQIAATAPPAGETADA